MTQTTEGIIRQWVRSQNPDPRPESELPTGAVYRRYYQDLAFELDDLRHRARSGPLRSEAEERLAALEQLFADAEDRPHDDSDAQLTGDPEFDAIERALQSGQIGPDDDPWADENACKAPNTNSGSQVRRAG